MHRNFIASLKDCILVTGSNGFIGSKVVQELLEYGFANLRCFVRPSPRSFAWGQRPLPEVGHPLPSFLLLDHALPNLLEFALALLVAEITRSQDGLCTFRFGVGNDRNKRAQ